MLMLQPHLLLFKSCAFTPLKNIASPLIYNLCAISLFDGLKEYKRCFLTYFHKNYRMLHMNIYHKTRGKLNCNIYTISTPAETS